MTNSKKEYKMKRLIALVITTTAIVFVGCADSIMPRKVVLVVKDDAKSGMPISIESLASAFTATLAGKGVHVINPFDDIGQGANSMRQFEAIRDESPISIARRKDAHGVVVVSVISLESSLARGPSSVNRLKYEVCLVFRLLDAGSEGTICSNNPDLPVHESLTYNLDGQKDLNQRKNLGQLLRSAGVKCAKELLKNPEFRKWKPIHPPKKGPDPGPDSRSEFDKIVDELANKMFMDELFWKKYDSLKENLGRKPRVLIGSVKNKSGRPDFAAGLEVAGKRFLEKLHGSAKFDVLPDDQIATDIAERLVKAVGTEQDDLINELKQHGSPDLYVVWELIRSTDLDGTGYYNFILTISHLRRPGGVFWTDHSKRKMPIKEVSK